MAWGPSRDMTILTCLDRLQESKLNVIDLSDDGILLVSNLVAFLYTGNYPANSATSGMDDPITYAQCIDQLHKIAVKPRTSGAHPNNIQPTSQKANPPKKSPNYSLHVEMYALADQYDIPALAVLAKYKLNVICEIEWDSKSFLGIVPRVYETTLESNQGLRAVVLDHARKHSNHFMKDELLKASFTSLLESTPEFGTASEGGSVPYANPFQQLAFLEIYLNNLVISTNFSLFSAVHLCYRMVGLDTSSLTSQRLKSYILTASSTTI